MKQRIDALNQQEQAWLAEQLVNATKLVNDFSPPQASQPLTSAALDRAFAAWLTSASARNGDSVNKIINAVGVAFGQLLVEGLGLTWVIAKDEQGSDLAVYGLPGTGDVLIYPTNFVAKRWERREANFLEDAYQQIAKQVEKLARPVRQ
jgi:hypothetical protein